jgi:geranylgeranylglycerol-phosphate geranylgeranyltransferase
MNRLKYYGLHQYYPRLKRFLGVKMAAYLRLCRPFTVAPAFIAGLFLTLASAEISLETFRTALDAGVVLALLQTTGQIVNQVVDVELDKSLPGKRDRPIPSGLVERDEAMGLAWVFSIVALARAFTLGLTFGLLSLVILFMAVFYSLKPFSPRRHAFISLTWQAFSRGFLPPILCFSIYKTPYEALPISMLAFTWCLGWQGTKDITDVEGDRAFGIKTVANTYGLKGLRGLSTATLIVFIIEIIVSKRVMFLAVVPLALYGLLNYEKRSGSMENTVSWVVFYLGLGLCFLIPFVERIMG